LRDIVPKVSFGTDRLDFLLERRFARTGFEDLRLDVPEEDDDAEEETEDDEEDNEDDEELEEEAAEVVCGAVCTELGCCGSDVVFECVLGSSSGPESTSCSTSASAS
jgi:hypothetical protein